MAITLIDKIKPKNNGTFPLVDAEDVLMPDGKRLSEEAFGGSVTVDDSFNAESENPVMNKVITGAMGQAVEVLAGLQQTVTDLQNNKLPPVTEENNGNFAQVVGGKWAAVDAIPQVASIVDSRIDSKFVPCSQAEYEAWTEAGTIDATKYYMIVGDSV